MRNTNDKGVLSAILAGLTAALVLVSVRTHDASAVQRTVPVFSPIGNSGALNGSLRLLGMTASNDKLGTTGTVAQLSPGGLPAPSLSVPVPTTQASVVQHSTSASTQLPIGVATEDGINMRTGPGTKYKILAQLPAYTRAQILAEQAGWYHIRTLWQTDGWIAGNYFKVIQEPGGSTQFQSVGSAGVVGVVNLRSGPGTGFSGYGQVTVGSVLEVLALQGDWYKVRSPLGTIGWVAAAYAPLDWIPDIYGGSSAAISAASSEVVRIAQEYLGARYVWGGSDPSGFDCSGLTWYVYRQVGVWLPAGSAQQFSSKYGRYIGNMSALAPGDLVFFERTTEDAGITHVGIYAGDGKMIAARTERLGVRYVSLRDPFWSSRFVGGIRPYR